MAKLNRTLKNLSLRLGLICGLQPMLMYAQSPGASLSAPPQQQIKVPARPIAPQLTPPANVTTVPYQISPYDYEQHMAFQKNEDELSTRIDRLSDKVDEMKIALDDAIKDIKSLKETRTNWKAYIVVFSFLWPGFWFLVSKDRVFGWFKRQLGMQDPPSTSAN